MQNNSWVFKNVSPPPSAVGVRARNGSLRRWLTELEANNSLFSEKKGNYAPYETARASAQQVLDLPRAEVLGGHYRIEVRKGILVPAPWQDVYGFADLSDGELVAMFTSYATWYASIPQSWSARIAAAPDVDVFHAPVFGVEGIPILRATAELRTGLKAPARVPIFQ